MTALTLADFQLSPDIIVGRDEHRLLLLLATGGSGHATDVFDDLLAELERAMVVADGFVPPDVVRMGSTVTYRTATDTRTVELVYPRDADIAAGKVSVLTPIGTALIGLRTGQSITYRTRDGRRNALTVMGVVQPADAEPEPPAAA